MTIPKICRGVVLVFQNAAPTKITKSGIVELIIPAILLLTLVSATWWRFGYVMGMDRGSKESLKIALSTNPPSEELELTCAGLWIGEHNLS